MTRQAAWMKANRSVGLCRCGRETPKPNGKECDVCQEKRIARNARAYLVRKQAGKVTPYQSLVVRPDD